MKNIFSFLSRTESVKIAGANCANTPPCDFRTSSHIPVSASVSRRFRYAALLLMVAALSVGQAWGADKYYILGAQAVATDGALTKASSHSNLTLKYIKYDGSSYAATTDISFSATAGINGKYEGSASNANISGILTSSKWGTGSGSAYAAGIKFSKNTTYTLKLGSKTISKISFLCYPEGNKSSVTIGGTAKTTSSKQWTTHEWKGSFTGDVSMALSSDNGVYGVFVLDEKEPDEKDKVKVETISVDDAEVFVGKTVTMTATVLPTDAYDKTVTWSSDNTSVATVNSSTGVLTGVAEGTATITATANDGSGKSGSATVTVKEFTCPSSGTLFTAKVAATSKQSIASKASNLALTASQATVTGGSMSVYNGQSSAKDLISSQNSKFYFSEPNGDTYFRIDLDCPLQVGDVISAYIYCSAERGLWLTTATSRPSSAPAATITISSSGTATYTVAANDGIVGQQTIYLYRATGNGTYFDDINITRPEAKSPATVYNFSNGTFNDWGSCAGGTLTLDGSQTGVSYQLYKDGVASGAAVAGTGSALNWTVTASGTYTVKSVANGTYSETTMTGSAVVTLQDPTLSGPSTVAIGSTITLTHPNYTAGGDNWESSNTAVATVTAAGVVTGVAAGTATITFHGVGGCNGTKTIMVTETGGGDDCTDPKTLSKVVLTAYNAGTVTGYNNKEYAGAAVISGLSNSNTQTATINGSNVTGYKLNTKSKSIVFATLAKGTFQAGDKVIIAITKQNDNFSYPDPINAKTGMSIYYGTGLDDAACLTTLSGVTAAGVYEYELTAEDVAVIADKKGIGLARLSSCEQNHFVYSVEITGCRDWTTYSLSYDGNGSTGGSVPTDLTGYLYGESATVLGNTGSLEKTYYAFNGWNTAADGTGTAYAAGNTITMTQDVTLYAQWTSDCTAPVVTIQPSDRTMQHGESTLLTCAADKGTYQWYNLTDNTAAGTGAAGTAVSVGSGYDAGGWTTPIINTNGQYQYYCLITYEACSVQTNTVTITVTDPPVVATAIEITGATEINAGQTTQLTVAYTPANANTDTTLTWTSSNTDIATVSAHGLVTGVSLGEVTITATTANGKSDTHTIRVVPVTVTLDANGGTVTPTQLNYGGSPLILPTPVRAGYACVGWYTTADGGTQISSPYSPTASITLYAHWEATSLNLHTPGVYETQYGQTLTTYESKKYEVFGFSSTGSNVNYLWAGVPTTTETDANCLMKYAAQTEMTKDWIYQNMYGRGSSGNINMAEFPNLSAYAMNYRENYSLQIRVRGYLSFAICAKDANATRSSNKYLQVVINGEDVTANLSTSKSVRRYALDKNTEYLITLNGISSSNNELWGFSLEVPNCKAPTLEWETEPKDQVVKETSQTVSVSTNYAAGLTWSSSDESVMTISGSGTSRTLNFLKAGEVTLTVMTTGDDGTYCNTPAYISKEIKVLNDPILATAVSLADVAIEVGETLQLVPVWTPADATNAEVSTYSTASSAIATVTNAGMLTGVAIGKTTVTLTSVSGLTCTANVIVRPATIPCQTWEGTPAAWTAGQMLIGNLLLTGSAPEGNTSIASNKAYNNISVPIINVSGKNAYIEGSFADGYEIESLELGVAYNSSGTSTIQYALIFSPTAVFTASTIQVVLPKAHCYNQPQDIQTINVPAGMKYFRIYRQSTEFGSTYGAGQSLRIYHITACPVTPCSEKAGTITITDGLAEDCVGSSRTLMLSGYTDGADIQWYRDGEPISGATSATLVTSVTGDYYATTMNVCEKRSANSVTLTDTPDPAATALLEYLYVKNGRPVDIDLFELEGATSWSVTPAISGCEYTLSNGVVHLSGTPVIGSNSNATMTLTVNNSCGGSTATATLDLHLLAATAKPTLAYVVTGTKAGGWTAAKSEGTALSDYLKTYYDVTVVNAYHSADESAVKAYYSQFDVVLVTDYPDTNIKDGDGRSYTNAIGCLIDIKPILTLETFVSKLENWQISSTPKTPSPEARKMKVLCTAHNIFDATLFENGDEITVLSGGTMQGFEPILAPNYMFISTIDNNGGTLVTCCERQQKVGARMILFGLQYESMGSITDKGKIVIHNIIQYLLETNPDGMADCSIVFDNQAGTGVWSDMRNWGPAHNAIPTPYQAVRILYPCTVDINNAAASNVKLCKDNDDWNGSLIINADASLSVIGTIREVHGTNYITTYPVAASDLVVRANASNQGALAQGDEEGITHATVQFHARGYDAPLESTYWQYMGTPFSDVTRAVSHYENSWMCQWIENEEGEGSFAGTCWHWIRNDDPISPFTGYALAQAAAKTFTLQGTLVPSTEKTVTLTAGGPFADWKGYNLLANSWMAPINIAQFDASDFGSAEATIYLFNTGHNDGTTTPSATENASSGQYVAVPVASASSMAESARYIPPMQGFYVYTTVPAAVTLNYDKLVYTSNFQNSTRPNRAPRRLTTAEQPMPRVIMDVEGKRFSDRLYLFENADLTNGFDNGWDGRKWEGDALAPQIMTRTGDLDLSVDASSSFAGKRIAFRAGEDTEYTLRFTTDVRDLRLRDLVTGAEVDIVDGGTYTFTATNSEQIEERFEIGDYRQTVEVPTSADDLQGFDSEVIALDVYSADGRLLLHRTGNFADPLSLPPSGIYILRLETTTGIKVSKIIF